jgi:hypothetical protein
MTADQQRLLDRLKAGLITPEQAARQWGKGTGKKRGPYKSKGMAAKATAKLDELLSSPRPAEGAK